MKVDVMFLGQNAAREAELFNQNNFRRACTMLGIDLDNDTTETEIPEEVKIDPEKENRFRKAVAKLKDIRQAIVEGRTDVKVGSRIGIDGFVFVV